MEQLDQSVLSIPDQIYSAGIKIYPNPVLNDQVLYFDHNGKYFDNLQISIWNTNGQIIYQKNIKDDQSRYGISLKNIPSGIYFLKGNYESSGIRLITRKIVIQ